MDHRDAGSPLDLGPPRCPSAVKSEYQQEQVLRWCGCMVVDLWVMMIDGGRSGRSYGKCFSEGEMVLFRGLAYMHTVPRVCHRDIKPQNILVDPSYTPGQDLVKQIYHTFARVTTGPRNSYLLQQNIWSAGCVLPELLLGQPLFPGGNMVDQLVEIIKVLGTPTREEIRCMNPNYTDFRFPQIKAHPWHKSGGASSIRPSCFLL
ncbi:unnamed protein product [Fraxinus pennsylvanica]|uniref:Protein kinase domain-containing protein n=1 Tax=Fraxinus pennsylvanica TaxID=56036 RepID=A0AAD1Z9H7_9LAMI|nr:unnamed protein product [Fraxinus pennsylvanica]